MTHPFLQVQDYSIINDEPIIYRITYCESNNDNSKKVKIVKTSPGISVKDIQEAEQLLIDFILNNCKNIDITSTKQEFIALYTNRCANQIAVGTRRGSGNTIIINSINIGEFEYLNNVMPDCFTIVPNDIVPKNKIIVLYNGTSIHSGDNKIDGLGIFSTGDNGNYLSLKSLESSEGYTYPDISEYARIITLI